MFHLTRLIIIIFIVEAVSNHIYQITDQNLDEIKSYRVSFILFSLKKHPSYKLFTNNDKNDINQFIKQKCEGKCAFGQAQLGKNTILQRKFNVKRFPYFCAIINQEGQTFYKFRGIVTTSKIKNWIQKIITYLEFSKNRKIQQKLKIFPLISVGNNTINKLGLNVFLQQYYLNDLYSQVYFQINETKTQDNHIIYHKNSKQSISYIAVTATQIAWSFNDILLSQVNQFSEDIYVLSQEISNLGIQKHIFIVALDSIIQKEESCHHLITLNRVYQSFQKRIIIFWMEAEINKHKKVLMGFNQSDQPPLIALFLPQSKQKVIFKGNFNFLEISSFINETINQLENRWVEKSKQIIEMFENQIQIKIFPTSIKYQNQIIIEFKDHPQKNSFENIINTIKSMKRINKFIWQKQKEFIILLKEVKDGEERVKSNDKVIIHQLNIQLADFCSQMAKNIEISLPEQACIPQRDFQEYQYKTKNYDQLL